MSKRAARTIAALGLSLLSCIAHSEPVKIFGVPLGAAPAKPLKICPETTHSATPTLCWGDKPFVTKDGYRLGHVSIPGKDLPEWAAYNIIQMGMTSKGIIDSLEVQIRDRCDINSIASSIAARFGQPTDNRLQPQEILKTAEWELRDIFIRIQVTGPNCSASFMTPEAIAAHRAYLESKRVNRPATP